MLIPARYVGFEDEKSDGIPFHKKFQKLLTEFNLHKDKANELDPKIFHVLNKILK